MLSLRFKSNLKCAGCVNAIKPFMEKINGIVSWNVDLTGPDKIIDVNINTTEENEADILIQNAVRSAGYKIEKI